MQNMDLVFDEYLGAMLHAAKLGAMHTVYVYARLSGRAGRNDLLWQGYSYNA